MRVFISADIEGVAGVVSGRQASAGQPEYETARQWMTLEVNAAIEGARSAGATEFVVCDSHSHMQNIVPDLLDADARLVRGAIRDSLQMQGIDAGFDALFVTGTHAAAGTERAVLDHTWVGKSVYNIRINGRTLNEAALNALTAARHGVPFALVTGDEVTAAQTREVHPDVEAAIVKWSYSRFCASSLHPARARDEIRAAAARAIGRLPELKVAQVPSTLTMEVDFISTDMADAACLVPGVERLAARTIAFTGDPDTVFRLQELLLYRLIYSL